MKESLKKRMRNYGFWVSLLSAILLTIKSILSHFDIILTNDMMQGIAQTIDYVLLIFIVLGVISNPKEGKWWTGEKPKWPTNTYNKK